MCSMSEFNPHEVHTDLRVRSGLYSVDFFLLARAKYGILPLYPHSHHLHLQCAMVEHMYYLCFVRAYSVSPSYVEEMLMLAHRIPVPTRRRDGSTSRSPFSYRISKRTTGCSAKHFTWIADAHCNTSPRGPDPRFSCPQRHDVMLPPHTTLLFPKELRHFDAQIMKSRRR